MKIIRTIWHRCRLPKHMAFAKQQYLILFMIIWKTGWRHVTARSYRRVVDWAEEIKYLVDVMYPDVEKIILVMDNLNTHVKGSLYKKISSRRSSTYSKKTWISLYSQGSWLNIAEIELNILSRQCLSRRIDSLDFLRKNLTAWESERNNSVSLVNWQFTNGDARIRLVSLYSDLS